MTKHHTPARRGNQAEGPVGAKDPKVGSRKSCLKNNKKALVTTRLGRD